MAENDTLEHRAVGYAAGDQATMMSLITGHWVTQVTRTLADLRVPELLHRGPRDLADLAGATGADPAALGRILRVAVEVGLVVVDRPDDGADVCYRGTPLLDRLRGDAPDSLRDITLFWSSPLHWLPWGRFGDTVRTGRAQTQEAYGESVWDYMLRHPEEGELLSHAMASLSAPVIREAVEAIRAEPGETVVDLGGATGAFVLSMLERHPGTTGIVFDVERAMGPARAEIAARGLGDRACAVPGDFFESVPPADVYLLKFVLHDWDDDACVALLRRCRERMRPGARVHVVEMVLGPPSAPGAGALMDVNMLAILPGREHDLADLDRFFAAAGLVRSSVTALTPPYLVVSAVVEPEDGAVGPAVDRTVVVPAAADDAP